MVSRYRNGRDMMFDVSVVSPLQVSYLARSAVGTSYLFGEAQQKKCLRNGVELKCRQQYKDFQPLIVSTYGCWAPDARAHLASLAAATAQKRSLPRNIVLDKIYARLGFILMRANSRAILDRLSASVFSGPSRRFGLD